MFTMPTAPKSIGGVLDDTFQLYRQSFWAVWPLALLGFVLSVVVIGLAGWRTFASISMAMGDPEKILSALSSPGFWLPILLAMVISIWVYGAQLLRANGVAQGEPMPFGAALGRALSITPAIFLGGIIYLLIVAVMFVLPFVASALMPNVWSRLIAALIMCAPLLFVSVSFYFFFAAIVVDDTGPFAGLGRSRRLVRGNWWRTAAVLTVGFIIVTVVYFAAGFISELLAMPFRDIMLNLVVSTVLNGLLSSAAAPLFAALSLVVYYDLKLRKFGGDLEERVGALA